MTNNRVAIYGIKWELMDLCPFRAIPGKASSNPLGYLGNFAVTPFLEISYDKRHVHFGELG